MTPDARPPGLSGTLGIAPRLSAREGDTFRCFVALPVSEEVKALMASFVARARHRFPGYRFGVAENLHITLQFLGEVPRSASRELTRVLSASARGVDPFRLGCGEAGCFPDRGTPRILYTEVTQGTETLSLLASKVRRGLAELGYADPKPFAPHVTLGRKKGGRGPSDRGPGLPDIRSSWKDSYVRFLEEISGRAEWEVREVLLMESVLKREGPEYTPVARIELARGFAS